MSKTTTTFAQLDVRKRISLAKFSPPASYVMTVEPSGRIVLEPAVMLTEDDVAVMSDHRTVDLVTERLGEKSRVPRRRRVTAP